MEILGVLLISPFWGVASPRLFMRGWLNFLGTIALAIAFVKSRISFAAFSKGLFHFLTELAFSFILLLAGFFLLYSYFSFGRSNPEVIVYWIFSTVQMVFLISTVSERIDRILNKVTLMGSKSSDQDVR